MSMLMAVLYTIGLDYQQAQTESLLETGGTGVHGLTRWLRLPPGAGLPPPAVEQQLVGVKRWLVEVCNVVVTLGLEKLDMK